MPPSHAKNKILITEPRDLEVRLEEYGPNLLQPPKKASRAHLPARVPAKERAPAESAHRSRDTHLEGRNMYRPESFRRMQVELMVLGLGSRMQIEHNQLKIGSVDIKRFRTKHAFGINRGLTFRTPSLPLFLKQNLSSSLPLYLAFFSPF